MKDDSSHFPVKVLLALLLLSVCALEARPQSSTTTARTPGAPSGSYKIGDADTVNLFTGNLNYSLPLVSIGGRGESGANLGVVIEGQWDRREFEATPGFYTHEWTLRHPDPLAMVGSVKLEITFNDTNDPCPSGGGTKYQEWRVTMTYVQPDGTEHSLRDDVVHGLPVRLCGLSYQDYGRVFQSTSGDFVTYVNDTNIYSSCFGVSGCTNNVDGYLYFRDGTKSRVVGGRILWTQDRNGNKIQYEYETDPFSKRLIQVTDSIGRTVQIAYDVNEGGPYGRHTKLTYKGFAGLDKIIRISREGDLTQLLRHTQTYDHSALVDIEYDDPNDNIFLAGNPSPQVDFVKAVWLPDGRKYGFKYNVLGQLARVDLPTGGAFEYDYVDLSQVPFQPGSGDLGPATNRVSEKRNYDNSGNLLSKTVFSIPTSFTAGVFGARDGVVRDVEIFEPNGARLGKARHYFYGTPNPVYGLLVPWWHGKEVRIETLHADGTTMLRAIDYDWRQRIPSWCSTVLLCNLNPTELAPTNHPFVVETKYTLFDGNLVSKVSSVDPANGSWAFDSFNNQTSSWHYNYGSGQPGTLIKRVQMSYINHANAAGGLYLLGLVNTTSVYGIIASQETLFSSSQIEYDEYVAYPLLTYAAGVPGWQDPGTIRGNPTSVKRWLNTNNSWIETNAQFDQLGNVRKSWDPLGRVSETIYQDAFTDNIDRNTFAFATETRSPVPDPTNTHAANTALASSTVYDYHSGLTRSSTDANGQTITLEYNDLLDRLTKIIRPTGGGWTRFNYGDAIGDLHVKTTVAFDETRNLESYVYFDALGRQVRSISAKAGGLWIVIDTQYDAAGRVRRVSKPYEASILNGPINPDSNWVSTSYDSLDRVTKVTTADGSEATTSYFGNTITFTDAALNKRRTETDALGRLIRVTEDPDHTPLTTTYKYDVLGNLREVDQGASPHQRRFYAYDSLSRLILSRIPEHDINSDLLLKNASGITINDPVSGNGQWSSSIQYFANGDIAAKTDPRGIRIDYLYDNLNRLKRRTYTATKSLPAGTYTATPTVDFYYDGRGLTGVPGNSLGLLTRVSSSVSETRYTSFNALGRTTSSEQIIDGQTYTMAYEYNLAGTIKSQTYPSGRVVLNSFDNAGNLSAVSGQPPGQPAKTYVSDINHTFTAGGATSQMKLGNNRWTSVVYNKRLQPILVGLGTTGNGTDLTRIEYGYGTGTNNGNVLTQTITTPTVGTSSGFTATQNYAYDYLDRVISAVETQNGVTNWRQTFTYDQFGNRSLVVNSTTASLVGDNPVISNTTNRIVAQAGELYQYDAAGNLTVDRNGNKYSFDGENTQESFSYAGQQQAAARYFYDGHGHRVKKSVGLNTTIFVYDVFGRLSAEYSTNPPVASGTSYITADNQGTPRIITNDSGVVQARHDYLPFGEEIGAYGGRATHNEYRTDSIRQKFTGLERDAENGLDYAKTRYYASAAGRFTSIDPLMASARTINPQTFNRYTYALNNPYKYIDPSGMDPTSLDDETNAAFAHLNELADNAIELQMAQERAQREAEKKQQQQQGKQQTGQQGQQTGPGNNQQGQAPQQPAKPVSGGPEQLGGNTGGSQSGLGIAVAGAVVGAVGAGGTAGGAVTGGTAAGGATAAAGAGGAAGGGGNSGQAAITGYRADGLAIQKKALRAIGVAPYSGGPINGTVPDGLDATRLIEVKNTKEVYLSTQITRQLEVVEDNDLTYILIITDKTKVLTRPLLEAIEAAGGKIMRYDRKKGTLVDETSTLIPAPAKGGSMGIQNKSQKLP